MYRVLKTKENLENTSIETHISHKNIVSLNINMLVVAFQQPHRCKLMLAVYL